MYDVCLITTTTTTSWKWTNFYSSESQIVLLSQSQIATSFTTTYNLDLEAWKCLIYWNTHVLNTVL